jgi:3-hydroxyacyl-CoA dehydrogenase
VEEDALRALGIARVAVIGSGTIGASWAACFLARGLTVGASDPAPGGEAFLRRFVAAAWPVLQRLGAVVPGADPDALAFHAEPEAAASGADFVQENAPEREEVKQALLQRLDRVVAPEVVIASSSSGLLISRLQAGSAHPERMVIGHPFNPPHLIPLVEVVGGKRTAPAAIERALAFYTAIGKRPIRIRREVAGHVANRLQAALWREAVALVEAGVASVADIDAAISEGPGLRWALMGPHLTFHLAGGEGGIGHFLDQFAAPMQGWWQDLGRPELSAGLRRSLAAGVADEAAGRDIAALAALRDRFLVDLLMLKRNSGG